MPAHTTTINFVLNKTTVGFDIQDTTEYEEGANNHIRENFKFHLIEVIDPTGKRYIFSSHDFLSDLYNSVASPATVATQPLTIPKDDTGVGRYTVTVYSVPEADFVTEANYGLDDCVGKLGSDGSITLYKILADITTDAELSDTAKAEVLSSIESVTDRYSETKSAFLVMDDWIRCYDRAIECAFNLIRKDPCNQKILSKHPDVIKAINLIPVKNIASRIESAEILPTSQQEEEISNLANALCCCSFRTSQVAGTNSENVSGGTGSVSSGSATGGGIGSWIIEDDFIVS